MLDQLESRPVAAADDSARRALQDDAMLQSGKTCDSQKQAKALPASAADAAGASAPAETAADKERRAEEAKFFCGLYQKENFELDPMKNGQGPFQSLEQMEKEGKINMSQDEILAESRRIRDRDFKEMGRSYYTTGDHVKRWTDQEIQKMVQADVDKPKGIDVSNWQHSIDWKQVKDAGYQFAFMKATEGTDFVDPTFDANRKGAQDAGLKVGYYHYFHPQDSVEDQVNLFCKTVGKADPDALRLVIDAEDPSMWQRYSVDQRVKMVDGFLQGVKEKLGVTPQVCIYCSPNFADQILGNSPELKKYSLWIANYGVDKPTLPQPWSKWDFWQYTDAGAVPGINGRVDLDMFNGTDLSQDQANNSSGKPAGKKS